MNVRAEIETIISGLSYAMLSVVRHRRAEMASQVYERVRARRPLILSWQETVRMAMRRIDRKQFITRMYYLDVQLQRIWLRNVENEIDRYTCFVHVARTSRRTSQSELSVSSITHAYTCVYRVYRKWVSLFFGWLYSVGWKNGKMSTHRFRVESCHKSRSMNYFHVTN